MRSYWNQVQPPGTTESQSSRAAGPGLSRSIGGAEGTRTPDPHTASPGAAIHRALVIRVPRATIFLCDKGIVPIAVVCCRLVSRRGGESRVKSGSTSSAPSRSSRRCWSDNYANGWGATARLATPPTTTTSPADAPPSAHTAAVVTQNGPGSAPKPTPRKAGTPSPAAADNSSPATTKTNGSPTIRSN
jgi:hypothetical protein